MPVTDAEIVTEEGGSPTAVTIPTVNASRNVWGTILNAGFNMVAAAIAYTQGLITTIQAAATALALRVTALEAETRYGYAAGGRYVFSPSCQGLNTDTLTPTGGRTYWVPFPYVGTYNGLCYDLSILPLSSCTFYVADSAANGLPNTSSLLATVTKSNPSVGYATGPGEVALSTLTLRRNAWLGVSYQNVQTITLRGTTGAPPPVWWLGSTALDPDNTNDVVTYLYQVGSTFTGVTGFAPVLGLKGAS